MSAKNRTDLKSSHLSTFADNNTRQITPAKLRAELADIVDSAFNATAGDVLPVTSGGTGSSNASQAKSNLGLGNVDNTADVDKPISTATQTALDAKANTIHSHSKADVGLGNVDNTSDANKPVSTAAQVILDSLSARYYSSRDAFLAASAEFSYADGDVVSVGDLVYRKASSSAIPDLPGWIPEGTPRPEHFGAGTADDTSALNAFVAYAASISAPVDWGSGNTYAVTGNLTNLLTYSHRGSAIIQRGSDTFYIGEGWDGQQNIIYVSASGTSTNDGLTSDYPLSFTVGFNNLRSMARSRPGVKWRLNILAGTYPGGASRRLETFPFTSNPVEILGEKDESGVPTTIFDGWSVSVFRRLGGPAGLNIHFGDLKFTDCTDNPIVLHHGCSITTENLHGDGLTAALAWYRKSNVEHKGGTIANSSGGLQLEGCYGIVGGLSAGEGVQFEDISGAAIDISRGSVCYARKNVFTNVGIGIRQSRLSRVRTQGNEFVSWTTAAIRQESALCIWNDDTSNANTFAGASSGLPAVLSVPGSFTSRVHNGYHNAGHLTYNGPIVTWTGTTRGDLGALEPGLAPFRMPGFWLFNPKARGVVEYEVRIPVAETVTFEISGESSGTNQNLASIVMTTSADSRWLLRFEFTGPHGGGTGGRFTAVAIGANSVQTNFGSTGNLTNSAIAEATEAQKRFRFYVTRSDGTGNLQVLRMHSTVSM